MTESFALMDTSLARPLLAGGAAGLGVALPLGAVGVLLLEEGRRGWRAAAGAAAAVALADLLYAALAVTVGTRVSALLAGWEVWTRSASAALLGAIAVRGLLALLRPRERPGAPAEEGAGGFAGAGGVAGAGDGGSGAGGAAPAFVRFLLLTLVNPATALYFVALVSAGGAGGPGGAGGGGAATGALAGAAFAGGVFVASLAWQQVLAGLGALAGARLTGPVARTLTYGAGYGLVAYYAVRLALPA
ncbi:lysine transporter LysE [Kitasatospora herbaricolor]|uniref:lysine transporter LysE n=1 Tax=Kitasatospora herbaricolor TaxID=68217 RepID=UPI0036D9C928